MILDAIDSVLGAGRHLIKRASLENPTVSLSDVTAWNELFGSGDSASGIEITRKSSLGYPPFWRAVNLVSDHVAKLPLHTYRRLGANGKDGKERAIDHPAYRLLRRKPNSEMTAYTWRKVAQGHVMVVGNHYSAIYRRGDGQPMEDGLVPLDPTVTYPVRANGVLWYVTTITLGDQTKLHKIRAEDMLHIRGLGFDGLVGYSVIDIAKNTLGLGLATERYTSCFFSNNARPSVVFEAPENVSREAKAEIKRSWNEMNQGVDNFFNSAVLDNGLTLKAFSTNAKEAQLSELSALSIKMVANICGVPPHKLGDDAKSSYASLEQENRSFLDDSLDPWLVNWEEECTDKLLSEAEKKADTHFVRFKRKALLQADTATTNQSYATAITNGWMTRNEVRRAEDMNTEDGLDEFLVPLNMGQASEASRTLLREVLLRMVKRIELHATRAAKKGGDEFCGWLEQMQADHTAVVSDALKAPLSAVNALCRSDLREAEVAHWLFTVLDAEYGAATECREAELVDSVKAANDRLRGLALDALVARILKGDNDEQDENTEQGRAALPAA